MNIIYGLIVGLFMFTGQYHPAGPAFNTVSSGCSLPFSDALTGSGALGSNFTGTSAAGYSTPVRSAGGAVSATGSDVSIATVTCATFTFNAETSQGTMVYGTDDATGLCINLTTGGTGLCLFASSTGSSNLNSVVGGAGGVAANCGVITSGHTYKLQGNAGGTLATVVDETASSTLCGGVSIVWNDTQGTPGFIVDNRSSGTDRISNLVVD